MFQTRKGIVLGMQIAGVQCAPLFPRQELLRAARGVMASSVYPS